MTDLYALALSAVADLDGRPRYVHSGSPLISVHPLIWRDYYR